MTQEALLGRLADLEANLREQQALIESQSQTITQLQTTHIPPVQQPPRTQTGASSVRALSIPFFSGEGELLPATLKVARRRRSKVSFIMSKRRAFSPASERIDSWP